MSKIVLIDLKRTSDIYKKRDWILQNLHLIRSELNNLRLHQLTSSLFRELREEEDKQLKLLNSNNKEIMIKEQQKLF